MKTHISIISKLIIIFLLAFSNIHAQEGDVYVSLGGGASIPLSDYAKSDFSNKASGFAKVGGNFNINFGYRINEYFSLTGLLNGCVNRYDYVKLQDELYEVFSDDLPDTKWVVESKSWGLGGLLVGATGTLPLVSNKFFIEGRVLGGFLYAYSPAIYITGKESGIEDKFIDIEQSSAPGWAIDIGAGFRYNRSRKQYFVLYADYMFAQPSFTNVMTNTNFDYVRDDTFTQQTNVVNISIGIGYIVN